jgi:hypothetical protein
VTNFTKERFHAICRGERLGDFGILGRGFHMFWPGALENWVAQGAPAILAEKSSDVGFDPPAGVKDFFQFDEIRLLGEVHSGLDAGSMVVEHNGISFQDESHLVCPAYEMKIVQEDGESLVLLGRSGSKKRISKSKPFGMPALLEHPVRDRATWSAFKRRLDPDTPERWPADWPAYVETINRLECPINMEVGGFFGYLNLWVGTENLMYLFYDDPGLIEEMMDTILHLEIEMFMRVAADIKVDYVSYWEDMAYKGGPMIGPPMVRRFMLPRYQQLNDLVRASGCDIFFVDCDGNAEQLIPLWLETGINFVWPVEIASGMDPVALRKKYGKELILGGGLDKRAFMRDEAALRQEVMSKVPFLAGTGPYFPSPDHLIPMDMPFANFCRYINVLREIRGDGPLDFQL